MLDLLMSSPGSHLRIRAWIGEQMGVAERTIKNHIRNAALKYGIQVGLRRPYHVTIRLAYLRGRELGLIA